MENQKPKSYRVTFFGTTINLKDSLGDDTLNGLSWLDNFNTTYSAAQLKTVAESIFPCLPLKYKKDVSSIKS